MNRKPSYPSPNTYDLSPVVHIHKLTRSFLFPLILFASAFFPLCLVTVPAYAQSLLAGIQAGQKEIAAPADDKSEKVHLQFANIPAFFIENRGQTDKQVKYYFKGNDTVYFTDDGVMFQKLGVRDRRSGLNPPFIPPSQGGTEGGRTPNVR